MRPFFHICGALVGLAAASSASSADCPPNLAPSTPNSRFELAADGTTATDSHTGLVWMRCSLGQHWSEEQTRCEEDASVADSYTFAEALAAANDEPHLGASGWRLPNKKELASIIEYACVNPAINTELFGMASIATYWTSTPQVYSSNFSAWAIDFNSGSFSQGDLAASYAVRLVRDAN